MNSSQPHEIRKRRRAQTQDDGPVSSTRARLGIGSLWLLLNSDHPNIMLMIFGYLRHEDLLSLSRTTKRMRSILLNGDLSAYIWKCSLSIAEGLPVCPSNWSDHTYASLVFEKYCQLCNKVVGTRILWTARMRVCKTCRESEREFVEWDSLPLNITTNPILAAMKGTMPSLVLKKDYGKTTVYPVALLQKWLHELQSSQSYPVWCAAKTEQIHAMEKLGSSFEAWLKALKTRKKAIKMEEQQKRVNAVITRLGKRGWSSEISKMLANGYELRCHPDVVMASKRELTEQVMENLDNILQVYMKKVKKDRLLRQRGCLLEKLLPLLDTVLQTHLKSLPVNSLFPSTGEVLYDSAVQDIVGELSLMSEDYVVNDGILRSIIGTLPDITKRWKERIETKLLTLIVSSMAPNHDTNHDDALSIFRLATTCFSCVKCSATALRYPNLLIHPCAISGASPVRPSTLSQHANKDEEILHKVLLQRYWNSSNVIFYDRTNYTAMSSAVRLAGLDPRHATADDMDTLDPIYECVPCHKAYEGRATLKWSAVLYHKHTDDPQSARELLPLQLLCAADANVARPRLEEQQLRQIAIPGQDFMLCAHCKLAGNVVDLTKHVAKEHQILSPTVSDVVPSLNFSLPPTIFYMWPPRIRDE